MNAAAFGTHRHPIRDFHFACPGWHRYTPDRRRAHEILFVAQSSSSRDCHSARAAWLDGTPQTGASVTDGPRRGSPASPFPWSGCGPHRVGQSSCRVARAPMCATGGRTRARPTSRDRAGLIGYPKGTYTARLSSSRTSGHHVRTASRNQARTARKTRLPGCLARRFVIGPKPPRPTRSGRRATEWVSGAPASRIVWPGSSCFSGRRACRHLIDGPPHGVAVGCPSRDERVPISAISPKRRGPIKGTEEGHDGLPRHRRMDERVEHGVA